MTPVIDKDRISHSIINQLNLTNQFLISKINDIVKNAYIIDYDSIKTLSKEIKKCLKDNGIDIQHSIVLNIISKAIGFQNHHSLKANLENTSKEYIDIDIESDSVLKKIFLLKEEFLNKFKIEQWHISHHVYKGHQFEILYHKRGMRLRSKEKTEINKFLKSYGFKPYKNIILLSKIKYDNLRKVAFNILQHYQSFFQPVWHEQDNTLNNYSPLINDWYFLSYNNIQYKSNDFLLVDSYSTDLPWNIIKNFLDYVFNFGTLEDIDFFEKCLKEKNYFKSKRNTKTLGELRRINNWEKEQVIKSIVANKEDSIKDTLKNSQFKINVQEYMYPYLKEIESKSSSTIKNIIIDNCDYFLKLKNNQKIENIQEKLHIELYGLAKNKYVENMEEIDDIETYRIYHDRYNTIKILASQIKYIVNIYKDVEENYKKYYSIFRKKGYILH